MLLSGEYVAENIEKNSDFIRIDHHLNLGLPKKIETFKYYANKVSNRDEI